MLDLLPLKEKNKIEMSVHYPETLRRYLHYRKKSDFIVIKYGAEWCGPCKEISPILIELAQKHPHVYFLDVDVDNEEIADHEDINDMKKIPHIKFFLNNELKREIIGKDIQSLYKYVERYSQIIKEIKPEPEDSIKTKSETEKIE